MNLTEINVLRGPTLRGDILTVIGSMSAEVLVSHYSVPHRNVLKETGYQRNPTESRITQLARELRNRSVDLPTSVLLNLRNVSTDEVLTRNDPDEFTLSLDPGKASTDHRLFVVDGQHRIRALERAINDYDVGIRKMKIPFVCMIGADEFQEMEQFHVVNSNAKSVQTDLALNLLKARAAGDPNFASWIEERGRQWEITAQTLTERLATSSNTWRGRIRLPNTSQGETTVPSGAFVRSLKSLLTQTALFRSIKPVERQAQVIDAYWRSIRRVLPDAFDNPSNFNIQKGVGVEVLHSIFPVVLDLARSESGSLFDPESYVPSLERALMSIEGVNGEGVSVQGVDFGELVVRVLQVPSRQQQESVGCPNTCKRNCRN